jgi:hypothetical protein
MTSISLFSLFSPLPISPLLQRLRHGRRSTAVFLHGKHIFTLICEGKESVKEDSRQMRRINFKGSISQNCRGKKSDHIICIVRRSLQNFFKKLVLTLNILACFLSLYSRFIYTATIVWFCIVSLSTYPAYPIWPAAFVWTCPATITHTFRTKLNRSNFSFAGCLRTKLEEAVHGTADWLGKGLSCNVEGQVAYLQY